MNAASTKPLPVRCIQPVTGDYVEEVHTLRKQVKLNGESNQSLAAYLRSIADSVERGCKPSKRLANAEGCLEATLALLTVYAAAHPDECLQRMVGRLSPLLAAWRQSQAPEL